MGSLIHLSGLLGDSNVCDLGTPPPPAGNRSKEQTAAPTCGV